MISATTASHGEVLEYGTARVRPDNHLGWSKTHQMGQPQPRKMLHISICWLGEFIERLSPGGTCWFVDVLNLCCFWYDRIQTWRSSPTRDHWTMKPKEHSLFNPCFIVYWFIVHWFLIPDWISYVLFLYNPWFQKKQLQRSSCQVRADASIMQAPFAGWTQWYIWNHDASMEY